MNTTKFYTTRHIGVLRKVLVANGPLATFTLRTTGEIFSLHVGTGRGQSRGITDGIDQERYRLRVIVEDWAGLAPVGRRPEKGDLVEVNGRRHRIDEVHESPLSAMYVVYVEG